MIRSLKNVIRFSPLVGIGFLGAAMAIEPAEPTGDAAVHSGERSVLVSPKPEVEQVIAPSLQLHSPRNVLPHRVPRVTEYAPLEELPLPAPLPQSTAPPRLTAPPRIDASPRMAFPRTELAPPPNAVEHALAVPHVLPGALVAMQVPLHPRVRVKDGHKVAPGSHPTVIAVRDPHACEGTCTCCTHRCVFVEVWVPPRALKKLKVRDNGREIELDYGKYEVEIEVNRRGEIEIDYDD